MGNPAAIPLSGIAPPVENPLQTYARLMGVKTMQLQQQAAQQEMQTRQLQQQGLETQNEMQQLQLHSVKGLMQASKGVDWSQPDAFQKFIGNAQQNGVDPRMITPMVMERQKYLLTLGQTRSTDLKNMVDTNNQLLGKIDAIKQVTDPQQRAQAARQQAFDVLNSGLDNNPQRLQFWQAVASGKLVPNDAQLDNVGAGLLDHTTQANLIIKQRQAQASEESAAARAASAKVSAERLQAELPGGQLSPAAKAEQTLPYQEKIAMARGQGYAQAYGSIREYPVYDNQTKQTVYLSPNEINAAKTAQPGRFTAPQYTPEQIAGQEMARETKQIVTPLTAFNTAIQHLNTLSRLANDLNNGNVQIANRARQRWAQETGNPAPVSFQAAVNAMSGEVAQALKKSGATDQEIAAVGNTFNRIQSPAQLQGAINTYRELLTSKRGQLYQQYKAGKQGKPAFEENQTQSPNAAPKFTVGQTVTIKGKPHKITKVYPNGTFDAN